MGFNHLRKGWEIFGGCPEDGEDMRTAMIRETKEEIEKISLLSDITSGEIRELDRILTEFY